MNVDFNEVNFTSKNLSLMQNPMNTEDKTLLQKIFTLINILDVNKDGTPQLNQYQDFLSEFFQKFIHGIVNIPQQSTKLRQKLHILENHFIPTLRNVNNVGREKSEYGYKTLFIVPLKSEIKVDNGQPNVSIEQQSEPNASNTKEKFLRPGYENCTIDVAYNPKKYTSKINIHETPGSYIDPGDRTAQVDTYIPKEIKQINLGDYGLPGITFTAEIDKKNIVNGIPRFLKITIEFNQSTPVKFENIKSIVFKIDRNQRLQGSITVKFNNQSGLNFNDPNIFGGNNKKNRFIPDNYNNPTNNRDGKIQSFLFLLGKLLGDLMQIVYVNEIISKKELNKFILFTNDLVVALRCVILKIPFLLSTNYREVSKSNCNVLYFYDDITALQQFRLILEKKREMFKREIEKIQNFISEQLSGEIYVKSYVEFLNRIDNNKNNINVSDIKAKFLSDINFITYHSRTIKNIKKIMNKLKDSIKDIEDFISVIQKYEDENKSETNIQEFTEIIRIFSSIKIESQYEYKNNKFIFSNTNKFISVKLPIIESNRDITPIIKNITQKLNDSSIEDNGRKINLRTIMDNYKNQSVNLYNKIKDELSKEMRDTRRETRKRQREGLVDDRESKRVNKQGGGVNDIEITLDEMLDINTEHIYNIFYSYCNYHGIIILENRDLITYLYNMYNNGEYDFELNDPNIKTIFDIEKENINQNMDGDYDTHETNMDVNITDPDILTENVIKNIYETITANISMRSRQQTKRQLSPQKSASMSLRTSQKSASMSLRTPEKSASMSLRTRQQTKRQRSPEKSANMSLRTPEKSANMPMRSPRQTKKQKTGGKNTKKIKKINFQYRCKKKRTKRLRRIKKRTTRKK